MADQLCRVNRPVVPLGLLYRGYACGTGVLADVVDLVLEGLYVDDERLRVHVLQGSADPALVRVSLGLVWTLQVLRWRPLGGRLEFGGPEAHRGAGWDPGPL